jgi:hypothetical protein
VLVKFSKKVFWTNYSLSGVGCRGRGRRLRSLLLLSTQ